MFVHLVWDFFSKKSPPFSLENFQYKHNELFASATFATSAFFFVMLFDISNPLRTSDSFIFPLLFSSFSGVLVSLSALGPKEKK
ncbi:hypothetical protein [Citrobacter freundii]|uniref:hypothetical protein n=1 Tax=Citrobacter freundii TaxID=546 RepID=UPI00397A8DD2